MFPIHVGIAISNDHSAWLPWFVAFAFRLFGADVKNLWFAQVVIPLLKRRMKLGMIMNDLGNKWRILNFPINKKEKNEDFKTPKDNTENSNDSEITMKQARFDVFKFGIRGLDKDGQQEARVALALRLGLCEDSCGIA